MQYVHKSCCILFVPFRNEAGPHLNHANPTGSARDAMHGPSVRSLSGLEAFLARKAKVLRLPRNLHENIGSFSR